MNRIAILLPDLGPGGAERLHLHLAREWLRRGFQVDIVLMQKTGALLAEVPEQVRIIPLRAKRIRHVMVPLVRYLRRARPQFVLCAMWPLTSVAILSWLLAGRPGKLFVSDHNQLSISCVKELRVPKIWLGAVMRLTYPFASGVIAVSRGVREDLCRLSGMSPESVQVIYNPTATGISPEREADCVGNRLWGTATAKRILSVGTLKAQKDHATLIRAFARLSSRLDAHLIILGEGRLRPDLEALIEELDLGGRVDLPGFVDDPYPWFRSADLFVLSSQWEGFGNVIVEALECGVPVVSTNCPSGPAEILEEGRYGKLVPVCDEIALANAMQECLSVPPDRESLINRARDFSVSSIGQEYVDFFQNADPH